MTSRKSLLHLTQSKLLKDWGTLGLKWKHCTWEHKHMCVVSANYLAIAVRIHPVRVHSQKRTKRVPSIWPRQVFPSTSNLFMQERKGSRQSCKGQLLVVSVAPKQIAKRTTGVTGPSESTKVEGGDRNEINLNHTKESKPNTFHLMWWLFQEPVNTS